MKKTLYDCEIKGLINFLVFAAIIFAGIYVFRYESKITQSRIQELSDWIIIVNDKLKELKSDNERVKMMDYQTKLAEYVEKYKREPNQSLPECFNAMNLTQAVCSDGDRLASVAVDYKGRVISV